MAASRPIMMFCSEPWLASLTEKWPTRIAGTSGRCPTCAASAPMFAIMAFWSAVSSSLRLFPCCCSLPSRAVRKRIRRRRDLERLPAAAGDLDHLFPVADVDVGHVQRAEDVDAGGALGDRGQVVVAHQQDHRDAGVRDLLDASREFALVRGVRVARLVRVTGEDEDVHALLDRVVADVAQPAQEVHDARVDPGRGVDPPVVFHADVDVGGVKEFDRLHGSKSDAERRNWTPVAVPLIPRQCIDSQSR